MVTIKTRAELDIEAFETDIDKMSGKDYSEYCEQVWALVEEQKKELKEIEKKVLIDMHDKYREQWEITPYRVIRMVRKKLFGDEKE